MSEINKLKKTYGETSEINKIADKASVIDREIKEARKKADEFHKRIQDISKKIQLMIVSWLSNKITALKKVQEDAYQKFIDHKNEYSKLNMDLKNRLDELNVFKDEINKDLQKQLHNDKQKRMLKEQSKQVEEKMKSKKKLTTEDILKFQGSEE